MNEKFHIKIDKYKIVTIDIINYRMFKDFHISFMNQNNELLPIIVIAGINGSGKTTLLDLIYNYHNKGNSGIVLQVQKDKQIKPLLHNTQDNNILYLPVNQTLEDIKKFLPKYIEKKVYELDVKASEVYNDIRININNIFKSLNMKIEFDSRDGEGNLFFRNKNNPSEKFSIDKLSTGEKTLVSKVLYLYLNNIKNKIILIDEPELSLHPSWQNRVLKLYETFAIENNCQIIIATHSPHIIGSAKNEYIRILNINENSGNIEVIDNILAYGRDIQWVLEEVMGSQFTREQSILKKFEQCHQLINNEKYDEAENEIDKLEDIIGSNDSDILKLRNELAFERIDFEEDN
jgi:predicted ATP-binding protein involved in virulence